MTVSTLFRVNWFEGSGKKKKQDDTLVTADNLVEAIADFEFCYPKKKIQSIETCLQTVLIRHKKPVGATPTYGPGLCDCGCGYRYIAGECRYS